MCRKTNHTNYKTCLKKASKSSESCCRLVKSCQNSISLLGQQSCDTLNDEFEVTHSVLHKTTFNNVPKDKREDAEYTMSLDLEQGMEVENLLASVHGMSCTGCARKITTTLSKMPGISNVNINFVAAKCELSFNPQLYHASDILTQLAKETGFEFTRIQSDYQALDLCMSEEVAKIWIQSPPFGVISIEEYKRIFCVTYDPARIGARTLFELSGAQKIGPLREDSKVAADKKRLQQLCIRFLIAMVFAIPVVVLEWSNNPIPYEIRSIIAIVFATIVQAVAIPEFYVGAFKSLIYSGVIEMDMLVVISISAAYLYSVVAFALEHAGYKLRQSEFFETSTLLILLIILGRMVSAYAKQRAVAAISLKSLQVDTARLIKASGRSQDIDARLLQYGDILLVPPHSRIVTDGEIIAGTSSVDESMHTGESIPVLKEPGNHVTAGAINGEGLLNIRLTRLPGNNSITDITSSVEAASSSKLGVQDLADKVAGYFTPSVVITAIFVFAIWIAVSLKIQESSIGDAIGTAITYSIAVLAISCPCALGLAVPMVFIIAGGLAARSGVIIKRADVTEKGHKVTDVVFDKTGTLTHSKLRIVEGIFLDSQLDDMETKSLILGLVKDNKHPVSAAIAAYLNEQAISIGTIGSIQSIPGKGLEVEWQGQRVRAGNPYWLELADHPQIISRRKSGETLFCLTIDSILVAIYRLKTSLRSEAFSVVHELNARGISCHIVSGDGPEAVNDVALALGISIDKAMSCHSPADKQTYVRQLMDNGNCVLFCGDGTNDAVAVAQAHIGVQIGNTSDITSATSDVVLLGGLDGILKLLDISKAAFRRIVFNFAWSAFYNLFAILLAAGAFVKVRIPPAYAGLGEIVSVLPVVLVALSLLLQPQLHD